VQEEHIQCTLTYPTHINMHQSCTKQRKTFKYVPSIISHKLYLYQWMSKAFLKGDSFTGLSYSCGKSISKRSFNNQWGHKTIILRTHCFTQNKHVFNVSSYRNWMTSPCHFRSIWKDQDDGRCMNGCVCIRLLWKHMGNVTSLLLGHISLMATIFH